MIESEQKYPPLAEDEDIIGKTDEEILKEARRKHQENMEDGHLDSSQKPDLGIKIEKK